MTDPQHVHSALTVVDATPDEVYAAVSDVTRTGEWSPICRACAWEDGAGPEVGAWFTGRNEVPGRTWETRSQVVVAEPGREFAWQVGGTMVRWSYTMAPAADGGTELTEHWELLPDGLTMFGERFGDDAQREIDDRRDPLDPGDPGGDPPGAAPTLTPAVHRPETFLLPGGVKSATCDVDHLDRDT